MASTCMYCARCRSPGAESCAASGSSRHWPALPTALRRGNARRSSGWCGRTCAATTSRAPSGSTVWSQPVRGSVQTNTPTHQAMTSTSSVSPNHSHDAEYGEGPITNRSTSSGTGCTPAREEDAKTGHLDDSRTDLSASTEGCMRDRAYGHELFEFVPFGSLPPADRPRRPVGPSSHRRSRSGRSRRRIRLHCRPACRSRARRRPSPT